MRELAFRNPPSTPLLQDPTPKLFGIPDKRALDTTTPQAAPDTTALKSATDTQGMHERTCGLPTRCNQVRSAGTAPGHKKTQVSASFFFFFFQCLYFHYLNFASMRKQQYYRHNNNSR